jgi:hypothetical protein
MIDPAKARVMALTDAAEDYWGLYELVWELNTKYPDSSGDERLQVARAALTGLLQDGLVELFSARWSPSHYEAVSAGRAVALVALDSAWRPPSDADGTFVAFAVTDAGRRAYQTLSEDDFSGV